jgi:hypothetical protein
VSRDRGTIAISSRDALIPSDTNNKWDVYALACKLPSTYCSGKVNSRGCVPAMTIAGVPSVAWPHDFYLGAMKVLDHKAGALIYSTSGPAMTPFAGGTLCIRSPLRRTPVQQSGGSSAGSDCSGSFSMDFGAWIGSGNDPALIAGASVWAQYWSRDPGFAPPNAASLSDATTFVIWP